MKIVTQTGTVIEMPAANYVSYHSSGVWKLFDGQPKADESNWMATFDPKTGSMVALSKHKLTIKKPALPRAISL